MTDLERDTYETDLLKTRCFVTETVTSSVHIVYGACTPRRIQQYNPYNITRPSLERKLT